MTVDYMNEYVKFCMEHHLNNVLTYGLFSRAAIYSHNANATSATELIEMHHVVPDCLGGKKSFNTNYICLDAQEHRWAHRLLSYAIIQNSYMKTAGKLCCIDNKTKMYISRHEKMPPKNGQPSLKRKLCQLIVRYAPYSISIRKKHENHQ